MTIPASLNDTLVERLARTPDEAERTWSLFIFLAYRASDAVFEKLIRLDPDILERKTWATTVIANSPKMVTHARAHCARLLDDNSRERAAVALESAAADEFDLSFFDNSAMLEYSCRAARPPWNIASHSATA